MTKKIEKSAKRFALFLVEREKYDIIKRGLSVEKVAIWVNMVKPMAKNLTRWLLAVVKKSNI